MDDRALLEEVDSELVIGIYGDVWMRRDYQADKFGYLGVIEKSDDYAMVDLPSAISGFIAARYDRIYLLTKDNKLIIYDQDHPRGVEVRFDPVREIYRSDPTKLVLVGYETSYQILIENYTPEDPERIELRGAQEVAAMARGDVGYINSSDRDEITIHGNRTFYDVNFADYSSPDGDNPIRMIRNRLIIMEDGTIFLDEFNHRMDLHQARLINGFNAGVPDDARFLARTNKIALLNEGIITVLHLSEGLVEELDLDSQFHRFININRKKRHQTNNRIQWIDNVKIYAEDHGGNLYLLEDLITLGNGARNLELPVILSGGIDQRNLRKKNARSRAVIV